MVCSSPPTRSADDCGATCSCGGAGGRRVGRTADGDGCGEGGRDERVGSDRSTACGGAQGDPSSGCEPGGEGGGLGAEAGGGLGVEPGAEAGGGLGVEPGAEAGGGLGVEPGVRVAPVLISPWYLRSARLEQRSAPPR